MGLMWVEQIAYLLDTLGLQKKELAHAMEVTPETISRWVSGDRIPSIRKQEQYLKALSSNRPNSAPHQEFLSDIRNDIRCIVVTRIGSWDIQVYSAGVSRQLVEGGLATPETIHAFDWKTTKLSPQQIWLITEGTARARLFSDPRIAEVYAEVDGYTFKGVYGRRRFTIWPLESPFGGFRLIVRAEGLTKAVGDAPYIYVSRRVGQNEEIFAS